GADAPLSGTHPGDRDRRGGGVRATGGRDGARTAARYCGSEMSYTDTVGHDRALDEENIGVDKLGEKLSLGVAARLSRYLQVLTQAHKMGKETISSQELADYTHV